VIAQVTDEWPAEASELCRSHAAAAAAVGQTR